MNIISPADAKAHLRLEPDFPDNQLLDKLRAAELRAAHFINRAIFADADSMQTAMAAVPAQLADAADRYRQAVEHIRATTPLPDVAQALQEQARRSLDDAQANARETLSGIVATDDIRAAILLIFGHLFAHLADTQEGAPSALPYGAQYLLMPHRIGWGI